MFLKDHGSQSARLATVIMAPARIVSAAAAAHMVQWYSSGGAHVLLHLVRDFLGLRTSVPKWHRDRFSRFAELTVVPIRQTDRHTDTQTDHATSVGVAHI